MSDLRTRMLRSVVVLLFLTVVAACSSEPATRTEALTSETESDPSTADDEQPIDEVAEEPGSSLRVVSVNLGDLDEVAADNDDVLVDGGSTSSLVLADDAPLWIGLLGETVVVKPVAEIAPDLEPRVVSGFNNLAACGRLLVLVVSEPDALVGVDVATGSVVWEVALAEDSPQIACGDADVVVVQEGDTVRGLAVGDGAPRWSHPISPDDPLRLSPDLGLVGSYDGVIAVDLDTGDQAWVVGDSADSIVAPSPAGSLVRLGGRLAIIDPLGQSQLDFAPDALGSDPWDLFVAGTNGNLAVVDAKEGTAFDVEGPRSILGPEVLEVVGAGPDGLIWAAVRVGEGTGVGLIDTDGQVVAAVDGSVLGRNRIALPGILILFDSGEAIVIG